MSALGVLVLFLWQLYCDEVLTVFLRLPTCKFRMLVRCMRVEMRVHKHESLNFAKATKVLDCLNDHCHDTLLNVCLMVQRFLVALVTAQWEKLHVQTYFSLSAFCKIWLCQNSATVGRSV